MPTPRPVLHHTPVSGWMNDPHGLTFHDGRYHLFFQHVPGRTTWDLACEWGHATSTDLLTWEPQPVALSPGDGEDGVWSGSVLDGVAYYTAVDGRDVDDGRVRAARPVDATWREWTKGEVLLTRPEDGGAHAFRDPYVAPYAGGYRMLLAGGLTDGTGALWTSRSEDLLTWTPPVLAASGRDEGPLWECPALVEVDGRQVLVVSVGGPHEQHAVLVAWIEGDDGDRLELGPWQRLTYGPSLYAASAFHDADGRPNLLAWVRHVGDEEAGWMGVHSLPWSLTADGDRLVARPHATLLARREGRVMHGLLPAVADLEWAPRAGDALDAHGLFTARVTGDVVTIGGHDLPWSGEPLRLVLDGPVLEAYGDHGVLALPVPATGLDGVVTGDVERLSVWRCVGGRP